MPRVSPFRLSLVLAGVVASALAGAAPAWPAGEAKMYAITDWSLGNWGVAGACSAPNRPDWAKMVDGWYDAIDDYGVFTRSGRIVDGDFTRALLCDPDTGLPGCADYQHIDDADVAMLAFHGSDVNKHWRGSLRFSGGPPNGDCGIDAPEAPGNGEMFLGDADLEFLHMSSCHSMDDDNLSETWRMFEDPVDSPKNGRRLHMATGFHGVMWISSGRSDDYEKFAFGAHFTIALSWMDNLYDWGIGDDDVEQCPVAYSVGTNQNDCAARLLSESYFHIINPDPKSTAAWCVAYFDGCQPSDDGPFSLGN